MTDPTVAIVAADLIAEQLAGDARRFPQDPATVQEGLEKLSQAECLVALDELMSRRGHNGTDLRWQIRLWRQDRTSWKDARDARDARAEAEEQ